MRYGHIELLPFAIGVFCVTVGIRGIFKRRITARGRVGPARTYVGRDAVWRGAFSIIAGLAAIALSFANLN